VKIPAYWLALLVPPVNQALQAQLECQAPKALKDLKALADQVEVLAQQGLQDYKVNVEFQANKVFKDCRVRKDHLEQKAKKVTSV
jgi:hypothetical protein